MTIKVLPGPSRSAVEKVDIEAFQESITDFNDLTRVMDLAMAVMGISNSETSEDKPRAFSRDTLSIIIEGPTRPQLTLVDIPGLIATHSKGTTAADVELVTEITNDYISQPRTICLAVISATNDYSNQKILDKVRKVDPEGDRTLGIITKPDLIPAGSGSETAYIELARNEDIHFKLGWHVLKNRKYEERDASLMERNFAEDTFFRTSNFKALPKENVGIEALRRRLSVLLFEHVKKELPKLRLDLETTLLSAEEQLSLLGSRRSTVSDCKAYLSELSQEYWSTCKSAVHGHYEGSYFHGEEISDFSLDSSSTVCRTRAVVQELNSQFADDLRVSGHKYKIIKKDAPATGTEQISKLVTDISPKRLNWDDAIEWVNKAMIRNRGQELLGNFNPLVVGELFWEQSSNWHKFAACHVERVHNVCRRFLRTLLMDTCPKDVEIRIWAGKIEDALKFRKQAALRELQLLFEDLRNYPINYNHYYTDTIAKSRRERQTTLLTKTIKEATSTKYCGNLGNVETTDVQEAASKYAEATNPDIKAFGCEEALDCLFAIYKVRDHRVISITRPNYLAPFHTLIGQCPQSNHSTLPGHPKDIRRQCHHPSHRATHRPRP